MNLPRIGFIGAGLMGSGMANCLMAAGHPLTLLAHRNRTPLEPLLTRGASEAIDAKTLLELSDVLFTCVPNAETVESLANDLLPTFQESQIWIDVTTSRPETSEQISDALTERGAIFADAPVTGGPPQAQEGTLTSLVGCSAKHYSAIESLVAPYSKLVRWFGEAGRGNAAKLLNNLVTQGTMILLADAYQCADKIGIEARALFDVMMAGAARSGTLEKSVGLALDGNYEGARFTIANAAKDLDYVTALIRTVDMDREPVAAALASRLKCLKRRGLGNDFVSSMLAPME